MTTKFQITGGYGHVNNGRVYDEHPKFGRCKTPYVTWVCLVTGVNQSKYYALSNLREVKPARVPFMTDMEYGCAEPPPMCVFPMPAMYPQAVWLAAANYYLHSQVIHLDPVAVVKSAKMIAKAG